MSSENARGRILEAAKLEAAGSAGLTVAAVARRAGVSRQAVHYHFGGLRGLRSALREAGGGQEEPDRSTRDRLLEAAERLLSKPGGGEVSVDAIAAEAGLTKGAFYHYFPDRSAFLREVAKRVSPVDAILQAVEESAQKPERECLADIVRAYYAIIGARADLIRNLVANTTRDPEIGRIVFDEILNRAAPVLLGWFNERIEAGRIRRIDPALLIQALFGPAFARVVMGPMIFDALRRFGVLPATDQVGAYVDLLFDGIEPDAGLPGDSRLSDQGRAPEPG